MPFFGGSLRNSSASPSTRFMCLSNAMNLRKRRVAALLTKRRSKASRRELTAEVQPAAARPYCASFHKKMLDVTHGKLGIHSSDNYTAPSPLARMPAPAHDLPTVRQSDPHACTEHQQQGRANHQRPADPSITTVPSGSLQARIMTIDCRLRS
jgi:hypothetical protein